MRNVSMSIWGDCLTTGIEPRSLRLRELLLENNLNLVPIGSRAAEFFVAFEHGKKNLNVVNKTIPKSNRTLVVFEPKSVNPGQYRPRIRHKYGRVYIPTKYQRLDPREVVYNGGGFYQEEQIRTNVSVGTTIGIVNENKFSFVSKSAYSFRARAISSLIESGFEVNLAGKNWNRSNNWHLIKQAWHLLEAVRFGALPDIRKFRLRLDLGSPHLHYFGRVDSAVDHLAKCPFSLVVENEPTYVTEKLFLAIQAGTVPIYVGPSLAEFGIPEGIAIEVAPTGEQVVQAVSQVTSHERESILEAGKAWISSPETVNRWLQDRMFVRLIESVARDIRGVPH